MKDQAMSEQTPHAADDAASPDENTVYIAAADQSPPGGAGNSMIVDPMGVVLTNLGERTGIATASASSARIAEVRRRNPALELRRFR